MNRFSKEIVSALINDYLENTRDYVGISQIPYCIRKIYFDVVRNRKQHIPAHVLQRMFIGTAAHKGMEDLLLKYAEKEHANLIPVDAESEIKIRDKKGRAILKGHFDFLFIWKHDNENSQKDNVILVDFKFIGHNHFKMIEKTFSPPEHYVDQMNLYAYAINHEKRVKKFKNMRVEKCLLVMIDIDPPPRKEGLYIKEFEFEPDEARALELINKKIYLDECIEKGVVPDIPYKSPEESWECKYCDYYDECWGNYVKISSKKNKPRKKIIPEDVARRYIELKHKKDEIESEMEEIKGIISALVGDNDGISEERSLEIKWVPVKESEKVEIDVDRLRALIDKQTFESIAKIKKKKIGGYYRIKILKDE